MPLSTVREGRKPGKWSESDRLLAAALTMYEDNLHSCGHPRDVAFNPDSEGYFVAKEYVCQACAELERHRTSMGDRVQPGTVVGVVSELPADVRLRPMP